MEDIEEGIMMVLGLLLSEKSGEKKEKRVEKFLETVGKKDFLVYIAI